ncbi:uncharacterized protein Nmag_2954 [Natrialba magadii ATCC 43099]|uniref:Uncharacterized protein n=1 Tax=Natrialba magadii (strain ATCC 43099 / DSM 3394 / CCM 3739 / CIP 104546 / IAM 13178 / JCM 8861 / NBRC 102185 / NCIMB 2190 / MS3) TaxID=547559 RepID=D3T0M7_NATMM|nr:hypothetical protein [Natrialba magadii]ADD06506.1 uncharacterized protein Nmag_2954 [Natrialba magadii ATCC 43099]ELY32032.1 hypothetical protein C500_05623 [Natrialba magadii ATCC 43099]
MSRFHSIQRLRERTDRADAEVVAVAIVGLGSLLTVSVIALGGYLPTAGSWGVSILYPLALLFPVFGLAILGVTFWWVLNTRYTTPEPIHRGGAPEEGELGRLEPVGRSTAHSLEIAAHAQYRCSASSSAHEIRSRLIESAVRVVRTRRGLDRETAREQVDDGTWTDDPVAAAFLSADRPQPLGEQLRNALDPGVAYYRRVDRTISAIENVDTDSGATASDRGGSATAITTDEELESGEVSR